MSQCLRTSSSSAFTLIELLAASALSALLMIGVLAVISDLGAASLATRAPLSEGQVQRAAYPGRLDGPTVDGWVRLLRDDLEHATAVHAGESRLTLSSHGALDSRRRDRTHRPVNVSYEIERRAGLAWIVRRQAALDVLTNQHVQRDLVCSGVQRFELVLQQTTWSADDAPTRTINIVDPSPHPAIRPAAGATSASESRELPDAAASDDADAPPHDSSGSGERPSILYKGLLFYPEHLPAGAAQELTRLAETSVGGVSQRAGATESHSNEGFGAEEGPRFTRKSGMAVPAGTWTGAALWRLRIWCDDASTPSYERVVIVREQP